MSLRIAFVGYNEEQTRTYFREMAEQNREQIGICNLQQGRIVLMDGTEILRVSPAVRYVSARFDQLIIADDRRKRCEIRNSALFARIAYNMSGSPVPPEFRWQYYDLDAEEESHAAVMRTVRRKRCAAVRRTVCTVAIDAALVGAILTAAVMLLACAVN